MPISDRAPAREALESILHVIDSQQETASLDDMKASLTHKVLCLTAPMTSHAPATNLTVAALRQIYHHLDDRELAAVAQKWRDALRMAERQSTMPRDYSELFETTTPPTKLCLLPAKGCPDIVVVRSSFR
jgi:hypothetical protein